MFCMRLEKISVTRPGNAGLVFEFLLENQAQRQATVQSYAFELWTLKAMNSPQALFLGPLSPDLGVGATTELTFEPNGQKALNLVWHFSWKQLQEVEDWRNNTGPVFEFRNHVGVNSSLPRRDGQPPQPPSFLWEQIFHSADSKSRGYPARIPVDVVTWTRLLDEIGFRHIIIQELPLPTFPPGFARPEDYLKEAWNHHRAGREDEALQCCYRAFECLGFNLYGDDELKRVELLRRILDTKEMAKKEAIEQIWTALHKFFHLGRHERGQVVKLSHNDGELAVVYATVLLKYLADV